MPGLRAFLRPARLWPWPVLWALTACAAPRPWLGPLPPSALDADRQIHQHLLFERDGQTRSLQIVLRAQPERLTLVGLSALGQRLFTLTSDGRVAELRSPSAELDKLDPDWILTELQLVYWPVPELQAALPPGLRLRHRGPVRTLWRDDELRWFSVNTAETLGAGEVLVYNLHLGYRLTIRGRAPADTPR